MSKRLVYVIDFSNKDKADEQLMALEVGLNDGVGIERCDSVSMSMNNYTGMSYGKLVYVLSVPDSVEFPLRG